MSRVLDDVLHDYGIGSLGTHVVVMEGTTDRDYCEIAVEKVAKQLGCDLAELPDGQGASARIQWLVPKKGGGGGGGAGAGEVAKFGRELHPFFRANERPRALMFLLDQDSAGHEAHKRLVDIGFDPEHHLHQHNEPGVGVSCLDKARSVLLEDLLSIELQRRYFESGKRTARVDVRAGEPCRFEWFGRDKVGLREFVRANASLDDLSALVSLIVDIRHLWGIGVPSAVSEWMNARLPREIEVPSATRSS